MMTKRTSKICLLIVLSLLFHMSLYAQEQIEVEGRIFDAEAQLPLPGVSIMEKGTNNGTVTGFEGNFTISVDPDATLVVSYMGYRTVEIPINGRTTIDVTLETDLESLDEVVLVAYGTQRKSSLTAAVSSLETEEIQNVAVSNLSSAITGRLPGVIGAQTSGEIGRDDTQIRIRGIATNGNSAPLVIVDGIPRDLNRLDPNTIESLSVLKDAAAVAPYGMAGANGVILITTKKGKTGVPTLTYNGYFGYQNPTTLVDMVNSYDYVQMRNVAAENSGQPLPFSQEEIEGYRRSVEGASGADYDRYPNTNAMEALRTKDAPITRHNVSLSGGTERTSYYLGVGYLDQLGIWPTSTQEEYNVVANIEAEPTETTTVALSIKGYNQIINNPSADGVTVFSLAQRQLPIHALEYSNGLLANSNNTLLIPRLHTGSRLNEITGIMTNLSVEQELPFIEGLSIRGVFSYDPTTSWNKNWAEPLPTSYNINTSTTPYTYDPVESTEKPSLTQQNDRWKEYTYQAFLDYQNTFGIHEVSGLAVMEVRQTNYDYMALWRANYDLNIPEINLGSPDPENWGTAGSSNETRQVGYVYRLGYSYDRKYLFEASGRYDGHYYFAPGKRYGFFPAFSVGYLISEESFMKENYPWVDNLKIRGSWGESGNLAGGPFQYSSAYNVYGNSYVLNGTIFQGAHERLEPNPFITWERAEKTDVGLEFSLWNGRLTFEGDYFYEKRNNMLLSPNNVVPEEYGIGLAQVNAGEMSNQGVDFSLGSSHRLNNDLTLNVTGNFTYAKNKLIQTFENPVTLNDPARSRTGRPLGTLFGLEAVGLFQEDDFDSEGNLQEGIPVHTFGAIAPGDIRYADINGDGMVDDRDETVIGNPVFPGIIYGLNTQIGWKGFDLSFLFQGAGKSDINLNSELVWPFFTGANATEMTKDYWTPENTDARFPRLFGQGGTNNNRRTSSWWVWNASYLRLKHIELGYSIPENVLDHLNLQDVRLYVSGVNLLTFSELDGIIDPEMSPGGNNGRGAAGSNARGWYYPQQKTYAFGLNITF